MGSRNWSSGKRLRGGFEKPSTTLEARLDDEATLSHI
jgi:hypothetical protein